MIAALILGPTIAAACASLAILDARHLLARRALERSAQAQGLHAYVERLKQERGLSEALAANQAARDQCAEFTQVAVASHRTRKAIRRAHVAATHRALELAVGR